MTYQNPVLHIAEAKNLFLPERLDPTIKEFDDIEVKRFHQVRVRRQSKQTIQATYTDWVNCQFCLLIDTRAGAIQLKSPSQGGVPEMAAIHLTRIVFRDVCGLMQRVYG